MHNIPARYPNARVGKSCIVHPDVTPSSFLMIWGSWNLIALFCCTFEPVVHVGLLYLAFSTYHIVDISNSNMLQKELRSFLKWRTSFLCMICMVSQSINAAPAATVIQIGHGQIQAPTSSPAIGTFFKATVAGYGIFYEASVGLNSIGSSTTRILGTAEAVTTTNPNGSTIVGVWEVINVTASRSALTTLVPVSEIPAISSTPPTFTFTTANANGQFVVNQGQLLTRPDGSTYTVVLDHGLSVTQTATKIRSKQSETGTLPTMSSSPISISSYPSVMASGLAGQTLPSLSHFASFVTSRPSSPTSTALSGPNETRKNSTVSSNSAFNSGNLLATKRSGTPVTSRVKSLTQTSPSHSRPLTQLSPIIGAVLSSPDLAPRTTSQEHIASFPSGTVGQRVLHGLQASTSASLTATNTASALRASSTTNGFGSTSFNSTQNGSLPLVWQAVRPLSLTITYSLSRQETTGGGMMVIGPSSSALAGLLPFALVEGESSTITTVPPGMSVGTITTDTCRSAVAMRTTTAAGSTVTQDVPELCINGVAFLLFGWTKIPQLCHARFGLFGFFLQYFCGSKTKLPDGFQLISSPPANSDPKPEGNPPANPPDILPKDPQDEDYTPTTLPRASATSPRASTTSSVALTTSSRVSVTSSKPSSMSSAPVELDKWVEEFAVSQVALNSKGGIHDRRS